MIFLFLVLSKTNAQVQKPQYKPMSSKVNAYWECLPDEYDSASNATYPLIISLPGYGNLGDGSPAEIGFALNGQVGDWVRGQMFPKSFTVKGQTFKFIIITPQFVKWPYPTAIDIDSAITYAVNHYRIDISRIYLTGLSLGGGFTWDYVSTNSTYANRIAAIAPVCGGGFEATTQTARTIAEANLPVWAFHNDQDPQVPVAITTAWIDSINRAPAPNPLAKRTIFHDSSHDAWHKTYDPRSAFSYREDGLNVYEWMLQFQRVSAQPNQVPIANAGADQSINLPANSVVLTGSGRDADGTVMSYTWGQISGPAQATIATPSSAQTNVSNLTKGTYLFQLMVTDNAGFIGKDTVQVAVYSQLSTFYKDNDKDGYGDANSAIVDTTAPAGYVKNNTDCNDNNPNVHPGAIERFDKLDNNCNGKVDDDLIINLAVLVRSNPTHNYFTLFVQGRNNQPVHLRVIDAMGRTVEGRNNVVANSTVTVGHSYPTGVYYIQAIQGRDRVVVKGVKQAE